MSIFRIYVDDSIFYHPSLSKLAITQAQVSEDAENIDSLTLAAPHNHPYIGSIRPMASTIVCKKDEEVVFEGRALDDGSDFYKDITDTLDATCFIWHRRSNDAAADAEWDASHSGMKTITISTEDVQDNASFFCEVTI